ncbi:MAG: metallophosphoesterase [Pirellulales bacterium]|nr:metallophosphoesterase [Pirellulales bacterium]
MRLRIIAISIIGATWMAMYVLNNPCLGDDWSQIISQQVAENILAKFSPKTYPQPPDWAQAGQEPLFRFAWLSDMHLDATRSKMIAEAFAYIDERVKPDFVLITGDNNAAAIPNSSKSKGLRRQEFLKAFLQKHLKTPYAIIPGDNWPQDFEKVFGPRQYSFDHGGVHFMLTSLDRGSGGKHEGLSVFNEETWDWMKADLDKNKEKPTIIALHEPVYPPTFLDAPRMQKLLAKHSNVLACFHGHLHADLEFQSSGGPKSILCPALGPGRPSAMKEVLVLKDIIVIRTIEYTPSDHKSKFAYANKWQRIDIPIPLSCGIKQPEPVMQFSENYSATSENPFVLDATLVKRLPELFVIVQQFLREQVGKSTGVPGN